MSSEWSKCLDEKERSFRVISAFWRILSGSAEKYQADVVLVDLGPNLGAINRAALIAADYIVVPLSPDLFSLQGLKNLGPTTRRWRTEWEERLQKNTKNIPLPSGKMEPVGYVILQHGVRYDRPVQAFQKWIEKIPLTYHIEILQKPQDSFLPTTQDSHRLALLKNYQSLMPIAQESRKPIFHLKPADGAIGAHTNAVRNVGKDFKALAEEIAKRINLNIPLLQEG